MAKKHSDELIKEIRAKYELGKSISQLSKEYKVSTNTIKYWSSKDGWIKKNGTNQPTEIENQPEPTNQKKVVGKAEEKKSIKVLKDIIEPVFEDENAKSSYRLFSEKEKEFIRYYFLYRFNIKAATLRAGYKFENEGSRLLRKPKVKRAIELIRTKILEHDDLNITPEYLIEELHTNLLKASGSLPQIKAELVPHVEKESLVEVVTLEEGNITEDGEKIPTKYKEAFKKVGKEVRTSRFVEGLVRDTNPKEVVNSVKALVSLYGYSPYYKLEVERFNLEKERYEDEKKEVKENETNSKNIIDELIGKADSNAKNNNS